jgi:type IV secretory pathway TraG/TraD family ATPase VirD4
VLEEYFLIASGGLKIIENCMAYVRGFGIQLMPVLQDLNQLQDLYPKRWQTFMSVQHAAKRHPVTLETGT